MRYYLTDIRRHNTLANSYGFYAKHWSHAHLLASLYHDGQCRSDNICGFPLAVATHDHTRTMAGIHYYERPAKIDIRGTYLQGVWVDDGDVRPQPDWMHMRRRRV